MAGWNMTGDQNPQEEKINKAIRAAQELAFESHPFEGKVDKWDASKLPIGEQNVKNNEEKELTPPKFKFNQLTEAKISLAVTKGEDLNEDQVNYLRDKIDFYKYFAKEFNVKNPTTEKVIHMLAENNSTWLLKDDDIKKALDYKDRDGSEIGKASDSFSRQESFLVAKEIAKYHNAGTKTEKVSNDLLDYMYNSTFGIENKPSEKLVEAREKLNNKVQETFERIMDSQKESPERSNGMKR